MFDCKACKVLQDENKHLRGLVDRLMAQIAPKDEPIDQRLRPVDDNNDHREVFGIGD